MSTNSNIFTAPWYPWYVRDALLSESIELMSLAEEGAYRRALDRAWAKGSIPADPAQCARAIGKRCPVKVAEVVLRMFQPMPNDPTRMINNTLEKVRDEQRQRYLKQSAKGKAGAEKRWQENSTGIAQAMPKQKHSDSDTERDTKKEKKKKAPAATDAEWLQELSESEAYRNLPVLKEFDKAQIWARTNGKQCTRRFFVAWLNRIQPMSIQTNGIKPDPGRTRSEPAKVSCIKCLDTGEVDQTPRNAKYEWETETVPCPNCKAKQAA